MMDAILHPDRSRQLATHVIEKVWGDNTNDYEQVHHGVFAGPEGDAVVVLAGAQVSEPGCNALRVTGRVWELAVLWYADDTMVVNGPRHLYTEEQWSNTLSGLFAATDGQQAVMTLFEVAVSTSPNDRADLGAVSAVVGHALPTDEEPAADVIAELLRQVDNVMKDSA